MRSKIIIVAIIASIMFAVNAARQDRPEVVTGTATDIRGGDTFSVDDVGVRLIGVATPARLEPLGPEAEAYLTGLISGQTVQCNLSRRRSFGRRLGSCFLDGSNIAVSLIVAGFARDCPRHSGGRYSAFDTEASMRLPLPDYCAPR